MKNYYDQQQELLNTKLRLQFLKEKRQLYFNETQPKAIQPKDVIVKGVSHSDKFLKYVSKIEDIDKEIQILEKEIKIQEKYSEEMETILRDMKGIMERIFVLRYIDGLNVHDISREIHYSEPRIYFYLNKIKKTIKKNKNIDV